MVLGDVHRRRLPTETTVAGLLVFLGLLLVYLPTASRTTVNTDVGANALTAWRIAHTGRPWMDDLDVREPGKVVHYGVGSNGHIVTNRTPGQIWAAVPFYIGSSGNQQDWSWRRAGLAAATMTAGAMALLFVSLYRRRPDLPMALGVAMVVALTTPVWSVGADALWTHPLTLLGLGGASWALARERWWAAGCWLGVAMLARPHLALIAAIVGLGLTWTRRSPLVAIKVAVPTVASLGVLGAWNRYVFGSWSLQSGYGERGAEQLIPGVSNHMGYLENAAGFLISPDRGLLVWTPLLVVLLPAVVRSWGSVPDWTRWLALGGTTYSIGQLGINVFHGGDVIYGYRLALELLVCLTPLYAYSLARAGVVARASSPAIIGLQCAAITLGASLDRLTLPEADIWSDNAIWHYVRGYPTSLGLAFTAIFLVAACVSKVTISRLGRKPRVGEDSQPAAVFEGAEVLRD